AEVRIKVERSQGIGTLDTESHGGEPIEELPQRGLGETASLGVALDHVQGNIDVIHANLFEKAQVVVALTSQPGWADAAADADLGLARFAGSIGSTKARRQDCVGPQGGGHSSLEHKVAAAELGRFTHRFGLSDARGSRKLSRQGGDCRYSQRRA